MPDNFDKIINDFFSTLGELNPIEVSPQGIGVKIPAEQTPFGPEVNPMDIGLMGLGGGGFGQVKQTGKRVALKAVESEVGKTGEALPVSIEHLHEWLMRNPEIIKNPQLIQQAAKHGDDIPKFLVKLGASAAVFYFMAAQWLGADNLAYYVGQIANKATEDYDNGMITREEAQKRINLAEDLSKLLNINLIYPGIKEGTKTMLETAKTSVMGKTFKERAIETAIEAQKAKDEQFEKDRAPDLEMAAEEMAAANQYVREKYGVSPREAERLIKTNPKIVSEYRSSLMPDIIKGQRAAERQAIIESKTKPAASTLPIGTVPAKSYQDILGYEDPFARMSIAPKKVKKVGTA